jgi:hypothetical protein
MSFSPIETVTALVGKQQQAAAIGGHKPQPAKSDCAGRSTILARKLSATPQLAKIANLQNLRLFISAKPCVFSGV